VSEDVITLTQEDPHLHLVLSEDDITPTREDPHLHSVLSEDGMVLSCKSNVILT
jgi:predicted DNA-binding protein with PD1-like motif